MSLSEPSWRVKSRPCPFYQQGRCLFGDSCNFVHEGIPGGVHVSLKAGGPPPPTVVVDSPRSFRSPTRSPRTTSLLFALREVIGDPVDDSEDPQNVARREEPNWSDALPTLVNPEGFGSYSSPPVSNDTHDTHDDDDEPGDFEGDWTAISDYSDVTSSSQDDTEQPVDEDEEQAPFFPPEEDELVADTTHTQASLFFTSGPVFPTSHIIQSNPEEELPADPASGLLSPIELSAVNFAPMRLLDDDEQRETGSSDSGYAESWKPPMRMLASPPRSPSIASTFGLLSSPFRTYTAPVLSPRLAAFVVPRSPGRTPSPPRPQDQAEDLDYLDSPREHAARQAADVAEAEGTPATSSPIDEPLASHPDLLDQIQPFENPIDQPEEDESWEENSTDLLSMPMSIAAETFPDDRDTVREMINETIRRSSVVFPPFTGSPSSFAVGDEDLASSAEGEDSPWLAYLRSSPAHMPPLRTATTESQNTIDTLYDIYSSIASPRDLIQDSIRNAGMSPPSPGAIPLPSSLTSTPANGLRQRIFTPPPPLQLEDDNTMSPPSFSSSSSSLDSPSSRRASLLSAPSPSQSSVHSAGGQRGSGPGSSRGTEESEGSHRVPFGFRQYARRSPLSPLALSAAASGANSPNLSPSHIDSVISPTSSQRPVSVTSAARRVLRPLRLSAVLNASTSASRSTFQSRMSTASASIYSSHSSAHRQQSISSVTSKQSSSMNSMRSSRRSLLIPPNQIRSASSTDLHEQPEHQDDTIFPHSAPPITQNYTTPFDPPASRISTPYEPNVADTPLVDSHDQADQAALQSDDTPAQPIATNSRRISSALSVLTPVQPSSAPSHQLQSQTGYNEPASARFSRPPPFFPPETSRPDLMFAIASDDVEQVKRVLESGINPNEEVGPQSALQFALTNDGLVNKLEIVKTLLAYGADPAPLKKLGGPLPAKAQEEEKSGAVEGEDVVVEPKPSTSDGDAAPHPETKSVDLMDTFDPATRYFVGRAEAPHTKRSSALIHRSFFRPLTRVRYEVIGQDRVLEQMFRVLSMRSRELTAAPIVMLLCGPSGHGKSLLARKFGSLLDVPTHTVNMTTLRATHDLWQSYSMSPYETPSNHTLAEFLINNEGKRCVVVLDEIEKTEDEKTLWSLLVPWELGRCAFEATSRHVDVRNVIWLGTSNIGHDLVLKHHDNRANKDEMMSREEYVQLMATLRPLVSEKLGPSILSRVTTVLPFTPFTEEEKAAICSEALYQSGGEMARSLSAQTVDTVIKAALTEYTASEGARSLHRAISNQLIDLY